MHQRSTWATSTRGAATRIERASHPVHTPPLLEHADVGTATNDGTDLLVQ